MGNTSRLKSRPAGSKMARGTFMRTGVTLPATFGTDDLVEVLASELSHDQIIQFMKDLDERVCDLGFTKTLVKHFADIVKRERAGRRKS